MSGSKGAQPLTPQKKEILQSLLARAGIHHEEAELSTPSDFFLVDLQSMSDAPSDKVTTWEMSRRRSVCLPLMCPM